MSEVKIATFNVNSLKSRLPIVERFLGGKSAPEVVCFQETKCQDRDFPVVFFKTLGYEVAYRGMKSYNGVAIASKIPLDEVSFGFRDGEDQEQDLARLAVARMRDLAVVCSYVPQGKSIELPDFQYKLTFFKRLRALFEKEFSPSDPLLWTGDLNVAPEDMDVTNPDNKRDHVCFTQKAKDALADVMSWGFLDVFRKHRPQPGEFSFWDYRIRDALTRNIGWRIDHLLATETLAAKSRDAYAVRKLRAMERPSDHTAVVGVFDL